MHSNSVRGSTKESRPTGLVLDTRSAPYPSPPRTSYASPPAAAFPHEHYHESGVAAAPIPWSPPTQSIPSSPDSFVMPQPSPVSPLEFDYSNHYRDDSASDTSSTSSIGSLSREASLRDDSTRGLGNHSARTVAINIAWHEPPVATPTSMYALPIPAFHSDLYIPSGVVGYEPQPAVSHSSELLHSWRPIIEEAQLLTVAAPCSERAYASAGPGVDCHTPPTSSYFAGPMYHH